MKRNNYCRLIRIKGSILKKQPIKKVFCATRNSGELKPFLLKNTSGFKVLVCNLNLKKKLVPLSGLVPLLAPEKAQSADI
jgi:hypothetical protein